MKKMILLSVLLVCVCGMVHAAETMWYTDFDKAMAEARRTKKILLADFTGSDWCGWCIKLDKEVFKQKEFKDYAARNLVLVAVDFPKNKWQTPAEKQKNNALAQKYGVQGFPTILLFSPEGKLIAQTGYQTGGAKKYVKHLEKISKKR